MGHRERPRCQVPLGAGPKWIPPKQNTRSSGDRILLASLPTIRARPLAAQLLQVHSSLGTILTTTRWRCSLAFHPEILRVDGFLRLASFQPEVYRFTLRQRTLKDIAEALIVEFVSWRFRMEKVYEDARRIQHALMTQSAQVMQEVRNSVHTSRALLPLLPEKAQETQEVQEGLGIRPAVLSQSAQRGHMEPEAEKEAMRRQWGKTLSLSFSADDVSSKPAN
ncbi:uncharacterized protein UTRI_03317_B [Ustilago trichophora]|uniref:Uncharacterized protein n=1 Tax=Ustilago trichophora TaxID=86804 RepID=A0A5C3E8P9_9BASI|nr:uncharacterized protein UTRI_03317_B [Ustilago trichophora]